jgi:hypothetical protein
VLYRVPKGGGNIETLTTFLDGEGAAAMTLDDTHVYLFVENLEGSFGSLYAVPKTGGAAVRLVSSVPTPFELTADGTYVYYTSLGTIDGDDFKADGQVVRVKKDGSGTTVLASNLNVPTSVAVDATDVYFAESGLSGANHNSGLRVIAKNGGPIRHLTDGDGALMIGLGGNDVYYATLSLFTGGTLRTMPKAGGTSRLLTDEGLELITKIVPVSDRVYFFSEGDTEWIGSVPLAGGAPSHLVDGAFDTAEFALDDCAIYYVEQTDEVHRVPR